LAEFRSDVESFVSFEVVQQCTIGVREQPPDPQHCLLRILRPSAGSSDSMTLAIGHYDHNRQAAVVDVLREAKPAPTFSPEQVTQEFAHELQRYHVAKVISDKFGGSWVTEQFARFGILCEQSAKPKSDLYTDLVALLNSRRIELVDNQRLAAQLCSLERRTARSGRDSIDHPPGGHDDLANSVAGLASILTAQPFDYLNFCRRFNGDAGDDPDGTESWQRLRHNLYYESGGTYKLW
jgi:hypothetical protein